MKMFHIRKKSVINQQNEHLVQAVDVENDIH